jgi:hypothetical protein
LAIAGKAQFGDETTEQGLQLHAQNGVVVDHKHANLDEFGRYGVRFQGSQLRHLFATLICHPYLPFITQIRSAMIERVGKD